MIRTTGAVLASLVALATFAGCGAAVSVSVGSSTPSRTPALSATKVAAEVKQALTKKVGEAPDSVVCPDDLPGKVGATIRCTLASGGTKYGVTVRATRVQGTDVHFNIQVDKKPEN